MNHREAHTIACWVALLAVGCGESAEVPAAGDAAVVVDATADVAAVTCPAGQSACGGACFDLRSDPTRCGECNWRCPPDYACTSGRCVARCGSAACALSYVTVAECRDGECAVGECAPGYGDCNGVGADGCETWVNGGDPTHCGACGIVCPTPAHARPRCASSACAFDCEPGFARDGAGCRAWPRPVAPLSTSTVTSRRPTLRWALAEGDGAHVELCRDRALTTGCLSADADGSSFRPSTELAPGDWFWRLTLRSGGATSTASGPTWQFTAGARSAAVDTSWGATPDYNADGYADVIVCDPTEVRVRLFPGAVDGPATMVAASFRPATSLSAFRGIGDVNGDGRWDLAEWVPDGINVHSGGDDFGPDYRFIRLRESSYRIVGVGDVDGDGYADVLGPWTDGGATALYQGGRNGLPDGATAIIRDPDGRAGDLPTVAGLGDVNGDGFADAALGAAWTSVRLTYLYLGGPAGLRPGAPFRCSGPATTGCTMLVTSLGDVTGDGFADVGVLSRWSSSGRDFIDLYLGGATGLTLAPVAFGTPTGTAQGDVSSINGVRDVDGDGYSDVLIGFGPGLALFRGSATGPGATPVTTLMAPNPMLTRRCVAQGLGDVDGDHFGDVVMVCTQQNPALSPHLSPTFVDHVLVYFGGAGGLSMARGVEVFVSSPAQTGVSVIGPI